MEVWGDLCVRPIYADAAFSVAFAFHTDYLRTLLPGSFAANYPCRLPLGIRLARRLLGNSPKVGH